MRLIKLAALLIAMASLSSAADRSMFIDPPAVTLAGKYDRVQLLVASATDSTDQRAIDLTRTASYSSADPVIATVDRFGRVTALAPGQTRIAVDVEGQQLSVPVTVQQRAGPGIDFLKDVRPILSKAGCAAARMPCGAIRQGGFKLSVFGFDPQADYEAITRSSRGRRLNLASPGDSLLLRKSSLQENHGGGVRMEHDSVEYELVRNWIDAGAAPSSLDELKVQSLSVYPDKRVGQQGFTQQLRRRRGILRRQPA